LEPSLPKRFTPMTKKRSNNEKYRNINPFISLYLRNQKYTYFPILAIF